MIEVESTVPLYIGGRIVTEFQTAEAHFRDLQRVHGEDKVREASAKPALKPEPKKASKQ